MYAIYGNMDPINIPPMLAYIPYMDPMGKQFFLGSEKQRPSPEKLSVYERSKFQQHFQKFSLPKWFMKSLSVLRNNWRNTKKKYKKYLKQSHAALSLRQMVKSPSLKGYFLDLVILSFTKVRAPSYEFIHQFVSIVRYLYLHISTKINPAW